MCNKRQDFSDELRRSVALSIPKVLAAIAQDGRKDQIVHLLPSYVLHAYRSDGKEICDITYPFFVPEVLSNRGKKRVYTNGSAGIKISFASLHNVNHLLKSLSELPYSGNRALLNKKVVDLLAARWIVTKGYPKFKNWNAFVGQLAGVQKVASSDNRPCTGGTEVYRTMSDLIDEFPDLPHRPQSVRSHAFDYSRLTLTQFKI